MKGVEWRAQRDGGEMHEKICDEDIRKAVYDL
jgi:hypothetical protein